jgi:hypothetical protein
VDSIGLHPPTIPKSEVKMAQNNGDFTTAGCRAVMKYIFLKGNSEKIYDNMSVPFLTLIQFADN